MTVRSTKRKAALPAAAGRIRTGTTTWAHFFQAMHQTCALLQGRKTWQGHAGAFEPMAQGDPFGDVMNTMPKYVVSTALTSAAAWRNSTLIRSNVVEEVRAESARWQEFRHRWQE